MTEHKRVPPPESGNRFTHQHLADLRQDLDRLAIQLPREATWLLHELVRQGVVLIDVTGGNPWLDLL